MRLHTHPGGRSALPRLAPVVAGALTVLLAFPARTGEAAAALPPSTATGDACSVAPGTSADPARVQLTGTSTAPGATGFMELRFTSSPYGVSVTSGGSYAYEVVVRVTTLRRRADRSYVVWAATPELDEHRNLGVLGEDGTVSARVEWNKFLVFVTAEGAPDVEKWRGPILLTGSSPASRMHTMAGHGIFEQHGIGC